MFEVTALGPIIWTLPLFVYLNFIAFLITLILILRIGSGDLVKPCFLFALSFLLPLFIHIFLDNSFYWLIAVFQTLLSFLGVVLLMKILGVFEIISNK